MFRLFECFVWLLAAYGLLTLLLGTIGLIRCRISGHRPSVRVVLLVRDAEEHIEYIIRNASKKEFASKVLSEKNMIIVDMNSADNTYQLLERLKKDFSNIETLTFDERDQIFNDFSIFSPTPK